MALMTGPLKVTHHQRSEYEQPPDHDQSDNDGTAHGLPRSVG